MSTSTAADRIDVSPARRPALPPLALVLAIVGLALTFVAWDWFTAGGLVLGLPLAIAAVATGLVARRDASGGSRTVATIAVVIGVAAILVPVVWTIAGVIAD